MAGKQVRVTGWILCQGIHAQTVPSPAHLSASLSSERQSCLMLSSRPAEPTHSPFLLSLPHPHHLLLPTYIQPPLNFDFCCPYHSFLPPSNLCDSFDGPSLQNGLILYPILCLEKCGRVTCTPWVAHLPTWADIRWIGHLKERQRWIPHREKVQIGKKRYKWRGQCCRKRKCDGAISTPINQERQIHLDRF